MTIAAALTFDEGILLAADTKHTFPGYMKLESTKIFAASYKHGERSAFAITGDVDWCVSLLQRCETAFRAATRPLNVEEMQATTERLLRRFYKEHVYPHPDPRPGIELFVVLAAAGRATLFRSSDTALRQLVGYDCRGTGAYLAHTLIRPRYDASASLKTTYRITMRALKRTKDYDDGCGLATEVMVISSDGRRASKVQRVKRDSLRRWRETLAVLDRSLTGQV